MVIFHSFHTMWDPLDSEVGEHKSNNYGELYL